MLEEPKVMKRQTALFLLSALTIAAVYIRVSLLGTFSFWIDEFFHVYAAKGLLESGRAMLPSGDLYTRAFGFTYLVSRFFQWFGENEISARMPSAIAGTLMIPVTYAVVSRWFNRNVGLITAFLIGVSPFCILWSIQVRMYALQQLFYLLMAYYFYVMFREESGGNLRPSSFLHDMKNWFVFLVLFGLTLSFHKLSVLFIPTAFVYFICMFFYTALKQGVRLALGSKYLWSIVIVVTLSVIVFILHKTYEGGYLLESILKTPVWAADRAHDYNFYRWFLQDKFPVLTYLYPLALLLLILKRPKIGFYVGCCFLVPFIFLSVFVTWKGYRYIFFVFPFFLIPIAFIIEYILYHGWKLLKELSQKFLSGGVAAKNKNLVFVTACVGMIFFLYPILFPWSQKPIDRFAQFRLYQFTELYDLVRTIDKDDVIICTEPFFMEYYAYRKPDFIIKRHKYVNRTYDVSPIINKKGEEVDARGGIPLVNDLAALKKIEGEGKTIWIITQRYFLRNPLVIDNDVQEYIQTTYKKHRKLPSKFIVYSKPGKVS